MKKIRFFTALLMVIWLPIFSASAASMVTCPHMSMANMSVDHLMHAGHDMQNYEHDDFNPQSADCSQCGICHFACSPGITGNLSTPGFVPAHEPHLSLDDHFVSITLPIFDPPPLARI